jgi:hypothetical protein
MTTFTIFIIIDLAITMASAIIAVPIYNWINRR